MNVKIFVLQHAPCELPDCFADRTVYTPIQCGRSVNPPIEGILGDDQGDNISALNARYNEMTAIYWVFRHYGEIGNPEFVGFDHYRRFLNWKREWLAPGRAVVRKWFSWRTLRGQYGCCHDRADLEAFIARFKREMPADYADFDRYWRTHFFYICNVFVMHRDDFLRYGEFIIRCIGILRAMEEDGSLKISANPYQARTPGFILEAMTSYWLWHETREMRLSLVCSTIMHYGIPRRHGLLWFLRQAY